MNELTPQQKTQSYWEEYFQSRGAKAEVGARFWAKQDQCRWRSQFDYHETANRWIARATEDERLPPERHWKPFGRNETEQRICAHDALLRERSCPGTYTPSELRDIHEFLNTTQSH